MNPLVKKIMETTKAERPLAHYYIKLNKVGLERVKRISKRALKIIKVIENERNTKNEV